MACKPDLNRRKNYFGINVELSLFRLHPYPETMEEGGRRQEGTINNTQILNSKLLGFEGVEIFTKQNRIRKKKIHCGPAGI